MDVVTKLERRFGGADLAKLDAVLAGLDLAAQKGSTRSHVEARRLRKATGTVSARPGA